MPQKSDHRRAAVASGDLLSRRAVLGGALASAGLLALGSCSCAAPSGTPASVANSRRITRHGGLVFIPADGELVIASDFHARRAHFLRWLEVTRLVERLRRGEDVYGLILGDVLDGKAGDNESEKEGDSRIIERIRDIQSGPGGERLILLQGNHEREVVRLYDELKRDFGLTASNQKQVVEDLYKRDPNSRDFNFLERINDIERAYLADLPLAVLTGSGIVATHAGPSLTARDTQDIIDRKPAVSKELLFGRPAPVDPIEHQYHVDDTVRFLRMMNASVLVTGHTPLRKLPREWVRDGVGRCGRRQIILDATAGPELGGGCYLALDLRKRYGDAWALRPHSEIRQLGLDKKRPTEP